jgi:hypothetical protein
MIKTLTKKLTLDRTSTNKNLDVKVSKEISHFNWFARYEAETQQDF